jgi:tetratricopeptide (TPR) repeat protein
LQAVVTRAPDNPVSRYNLGRAHAARGEYEQARQQFQKAIELRPDYVLARLALAQLQVARADFDAALKTAEAVLAIDKGNVNAAPDRIRRADGAEEVRRFARHAGCHAQGQSRLARCTVPVGRGQSGGEPV